MQWEVAKDVDFKHITATGKVLTTAAQDFTVKVDVTGLAAGQVYFYRFKSASKYSITGQTKTLATQVQSVQFAVCSCSNFPAGYFHVYKEMAKQDVDVVIHLGDYIYEYGMGGYATEEAVEMGRALADDNNAEIIRLDGYRKRYALYRLDPDLQAAHQRHPFIVIWDDHELANDTWKRVLKIISQILKAISLNVNLRHWRPILNGCQSVQLMISISRFIVNLILARLFN